MDFESNRYTIILVLVVLFLAWYYYQSSNESFKSQRGIKTWRSQSIKGRGRVSVTATPPEVVAPPPPPPVLVAPPVQVPKIVKPSTSGEIDFGDLM
jgi:hypothetical protein